MSDPLPTRRVRRILAAFHPSTTSPIAIDAAVDLAARLRAELRALFIEDANLLGLAEFPFVRQVGVHGLIGKSFGREAMEGELRSFAAQAERHLAKAAGRRRIRWSFTTARGRIDEQIKAVAGTADLLILESSSRPVGRVLQLEASVRTLAKLAGGSVLMVHPTHSVSGPVHAIVESAADAARVTAAAAELAEHFESTLGVHLMAIDEAGREEVGAIVRDHLGGIAESASVEGLSACNTQDLKRLLDLTSGGTLILSAESALLVDETAWRKIAKAPCAVLLVR